MMEMSASAWEEYEKHYKAGYEKGRADQKHEDLDAQVILTKHEIKVLETSLIKKILTAIESEYDLNYGEMLLNPRNFYDLVEGYLPSDSECKRD